MDYFSGNNSAQKQKKFIKGLRKLGMLLCSEPTIDVLEQLSIILAFLLYQLFKAADKKVGWFGGKYKKKLIFVPDAGTKPEEKHEVSETVLPLILLNKTFMEQMDEAGAEIPEMLYNLKSIVDKESKITEFEIHQSSMNSATDIKNAFHVFAVFRTSESDEGDFWWSLEKNTKHIVLQRSRNKDDVKNKLYGEERIKVESVVENLAGKGSIKDLFAMLLMNQIQERYNIVESNCQCLVAFISKRITEIGYDYKGYFEYSPPECGRNSKLKQLQSIYFLTSDWPTIFILVNLGVTDLIDKVIQSENHDINALHEGINPLHFAVMLEKTEMVKHLLKDPINADPTTRDSKFGRNALHWAVLNCWEAEIFDLLLAHDKVKIDDVDGDGQTALHLAASVSNVMAVEKLIEKGANPNVSDKEGHTPLHVATSHGSETEIIDLTLQAQKQNHVDDDKTQDGSMTALYYAAESSNKIMAQHLINKGADLHSRDNKGNSPLHCAALKAKDLRIIDLLLRKMKDNDKTQYRNDDKLLCCAYRNENLLGAEIIARLFKGNNKIQKLRLAAQILEWVLLGLLPLSFIVPFGPIPTIPTNPKPMTLGSFNAVKRNFYLKKLDRVGIVSAKTAQEIDEIMKEDFQNRETPLLVAIGANNVNAVRRLLEKGADTTVRNAYGLTPFQVAATRNKDSEILDLLLATGKVDINDGGQSGYTLLHWAMATPDVTAIYFLFSNGANPNVADRNGATPLHVAAYCADNTDVLGLILETKQVDINRRDKNGQTALHYAVRGKRVKNVRYLLKNGADRTICDKKGNTPVHLAEAAVNQDSKILDLLLANENKTEIDERNNTEDLELPPSQKDVANVNSLDNSGAQQHIQEESEEISNPLQGATQDGNPCDESKGKFPRKRRVALDGQEDSKQ